MQLARAFGSLAFVALLAQACSSSSTSGGGPGGGNGSVDAGGNGGGSGNDGGGAASEGGGSGGAVPRVVVDAQVAAGANANCNVTAGPLLEIGSFGNPPTTPVMPVDDQSSFGGGTATVSCKVAPNAAGFDVRLQASLTGSSGGSITVQGAVTESGMQTGLNVVTASSTDMFAQTDCTMTYDSSPSMGVAAGRIWGVVTCGKGVDLAKSHTCQVTAQIRFENCAQQ